ncbi:SRPBCC domain-containing protein [Agromyces silvae]|uniref:SRPBCC domain-containing protein n=1 Tax=Agromyces silvae TaxID=3388266 RepID=UPI00280A5FA8|nr:SRPBCC domain-containing protein [Agromyces protaetiae]
MKLHETSVEASAHHTKGTIMESMTKNEASVVDDAAFTVRRTIRIAAPIEKVWAAVTEPAHISRWFGRVTLDGAGAGAVGTMTFDEYGAIPLRVEALHEPRMVSYRWNNDDALGALPDAFDETRATTFTFTLEPTAEGTQLTVVETGFDLTSDPAANMASHAEGWTLELDKLVALLEVGLEPDA